MFKMDTTSRKPPLARQAHGQPSTGPAVKDQVRMVVGDLEGVLGELRSVVGDLKALVGQIDEVTTKIDKHYGPDSPINDSAQATSKHTSPDQCALSQCGPLMSQPHSCHVLQLPPGHVWHIVPSVSCIPGCLAASSVKSVSRSSTCTAHKSLGSGSGSRSGTGSGLNSGHHLLGLKPVEKKISNASSSSSLAKKSIISEGNNVSSRSKSSRRSVTSPSSSSVSSMTSESSGSYSLCDSECSMFQDDSGYDPWRKLCVRGYDGDDPWAYDQTRVIKKKARAGSDRKASMAYSISPETTTPKTVRKAGSQDSELESSSSDSSSPSNEPDYDGMYEKELDEKLELEFDDDLELFETIENGIHGTADLETSMCNASYNRDINTWRQYSGVSMETISDDLWSDMSDTHSEDILNDNFVIPLLAKAKQLSANSATNQTNYHWRTHIEP